MCIRYIHRRPLTNTHTHQRTHQCTHMEHTLHTKLHHGRSLFNHWVNTLTLFHTTVLKEAAWWFHHVPQICGRSSTTTCAHGSAEGRLKTAVKTTIKLVRFTEAVKGVILKDLQIWVVMIVYETHTAHRFQFHRKQRVPFQYLPWLNGREC